MRKGWVALGMAFAATSLWAAGDGNRVRIEGIAVQPTDRLDQGGLQVEADSGSGARLAWEHVWNGRYGLELGGAVSSHASKASVGGVDISVGEVRMTPVTASFLFHPRARRRFDPFVGAGLALVRYGDVEFELLGSPPERSAIDDDLTWTVQAGFDLGFNGPYGLSFALQYLAADARLADVPGAPTLPLRPWVGAVGLLIRF
jgi:outer membrane protein W